MMIAVPCPIPREYNSALPTGMRLSRGAVFRLRSAAAVRPGNCHVAQANANTAKTKVRFMALKLHQTVRRCNLHAIPAHDERKAVVNPNQKARVLFVRR